MDEIKNEIIETPEKRNFLEELLSVVKDKTLTVEQKRERFEDYHENDIADVLPLVTKEERKKIYSALGLEKVADIFSYLPDADEYLSELTSESVADVIENMDADDAVDLLEELDEDKKQEIIELLETDVREDIDLINSYDEDLIGSRMTTNFVTVLKSYSVKTAMSEVIKLAEKNDNISTIYVLDDDQTFYGAIELRDLVIARADTPLDDIIITSYPFVYDKESISDCIEQLKDYSEDSIPVLGEDKKILGVITSGDVAEAVEGELGDDYAKLAGLTEAEDLNETLPMSIKKRAPWLIALLLLDLVVSSVTGIFEKIIDLLPFIVCFQSLILGMSGNVGTQSLAVTIRVLMDDNLSGKDKFKFVLKEIKIGLVNGIILGLVGVAVIGGYMYYIKGFPLIKSFATSGCIGGALLLSMLFASLTGTVLPMFFKKINVDPAAASGPLITTVNDMVGVVTYYGLSWILLIQILKLV